MLKAFPFTLFPLLLYNAIAFIVPGMDSSLAPPGGAADVAWAHPQFGIPLFSGVPWEITGGDLIILFALVCLFFEMLRATVATRGALTNHLASVVVLIIYAVEFLVVARCGNSTFFILTAIALLDVLAGFAVSLRVAARDLNLATPTGG
ncbi:MAG: hypothetical protein IT535_06160 [Bauldia sp.]|nr:hypothetical protein [Bauldia sp.]